MKKTKLESDYDALLGEISKLSSLTVEAYQNTLNALKTLDVEIALQIIKSDQNIDDLQEEIQEELTDVSLGIDLGLKELAICSNGKVYKNINKSYVVRKIEKRLKRLQKQVSRKYEQNKKGKEYVKTKNIIKLEKQIQQVYRRLANIRSNYLHKTTTSIVKTKPYRVVIEDLNVKGMMKNKHLSDAIRKQGFYEFKRQLEYKCKFRGIQLVVADRFYPSSKTCSQCGEIKKDLKLKDRVYKCSCGLSIDRDLNASINLSRYKLA